MSDSNIREIQFGTHSVSIDTSATPIGHAAKHINDILSLHISHPVLFMVAGGSAMPIVEKINPEFLSDLLTVTVTDERFTTDIEHNNFDTLQTTYFYNELIQVGAYCINTSVVEGDTLELHAQRFEKNINEWRKEFPKGIIIGLFGMGTDGHIAGVIPGIYAEGEFTERFLGDRTVATVTDTTGKSAFEHRVTVTLNFMKEIDFPLVYLSGDAKADALRKAIDPHTDITQVPAKIIQELKSPVIFTDIQA
jgi:6-phosphogluconolactonase/glucosamine-6-phosphate isomerase/deaminase